VSALSRLRPLVLVVAVALAVTGCGFDTTVGDGTNRARAQEIVDDIQSAIDEARAQNSADTGDVGEDPPAQTQAIRTDTNTAFVYEEYQATLNGVIASLDEFWARELPATFDVTYTRPARFQWYRPEQESGPRCGGEEAPAKNAFYCSDGDFIAWDETGLMIPYYVSSGDFAAAFVLAHEFGHAMQFRLPEQEQLGVLRELQADCFAGAWARDVQEQGFLEAGDLDEATLAVFSARDLPGTSFTDPRAHGTGFERTRAFADGYEGGPATCYPAPAEDWVVEAQQ
jgi:predicted metalloprotease